MQIVKNNILSSNSRICKRDKINAQIIPFTILAKSFPGLQPDHEKRVADCLQVADWQLYLCQTHIVFVQKITTNSNSIMPAYLDILL